MALSYEELEQLVAALLHAMGYKPRVTPTGPDRAMNPITRVNLDELATLIVDHYESFDSDDRTLLPPVRVYWPTA